MITQLIGEEQKLMWQMQKLTELYGTRCTTDLFLIAYSVNSRSQALLWGVQILPLYNLQQK